jgi:hypothetical protein
MRKQKNIVIKKGKLGLLFWLFVCLLGSFIVVAIERSIYNEIVGFYMSLSDGILLWLIVTLTLLMISAPIILIIYLLSKRFDNLSRILINILLLTFVISFIVTVYLTRSYAEAFYLISPYVILTFVFGKIYLKKESAVTAT